MTRPMIQFVCATPQDAIQVCVGNARIEGTNPVAARLVARMFDGLQQEICACTSRALANNQELSIRLTGLEAPELVYTLGEAKEVGADTCELPFTVYAVARGGAAGTWERVFYFLPAGTRDFLWAFLAPGKCACGREFERDTCRVFTNPKGRIALMCGDTSCKEAKSVSLSLDGNSG